MTPDTWERRNIPSTAGWNTPALPPAPVPSGTYPLLTGICSPAADTIRFEGVRFLTASVGAVGYAVVRGTAPFLGGPTAIYEFAAGSPDGNGWSLITHTDTVIELHNATFVPADVVHGVAFHDALGMNMYYYEPWGDPSPYSAPVDGAGCL